MNGDDQLLRSRSLSTLHHPHQSDGIRQPRAESQQLGAIRATHKLERRWGVIFLAQVNSLAARQH